MTKAEIASLWVEFRKLYITFFSFRFRIQVSFFCTVVVLLYVLFSYASVQLNCRFLYVKVRLLSIICQDLSQLCSDATTLVTTVFNSLCSIFGMVSRMYSNSKQFTNQGTINNVRMEIFHLFHQI